MTDPQIPIHQREYEALLWCLSNICNVPDRVTDDPADPLFVLLAEGFERDAIMDAAELMIDRLSKPKSTLGEPLTPLDRAMLRVCVENSTWVTAYIQHGALAGLDEKGCRKILRDLAVKFETIAIHVNHIPFD